MEPDIAQDSTHGVGEVGACTKNQEGEAVLRVEGLRSDDPSG